MIKKQKKKGSTVAAWEREAGKYTLEDKKRKRKERNRIERKIK
jgi:hypothetical protein